jgi:hypothetical protein
VKCDNCGATKSITFITFGLVDKRKGTSVFCLGCWLSTEPPEPDAKQRAAGGEANQ